MLWFDRVSTQHFMNAARREARSCAKEVCAILEARRMVKTAGASKDIFFHVDPKLAAKYNINFKLMDENDKVEAGSADLEPASEPKEIFAKADDDFEESTVSFVSKSTSEPNYLCSIVLQKPEGKVYCVSMYMMETYLGRYAFRANFYFREGSRKAAKKCFDRVARAVKELRQDVMDDGILQGRVPHMAKKRLSGIEGEIEPKVNRMANYLDPDNAPPPTDASKNFSTYIPTRRSVLEDLDI